MPSAAPGRRCLNPRPRREGAKRWANVAKRKAFLLRLDPRIHDAVKRWADDDLRSVNAQIEYLLRKALADASREKFDGE